MENCIIEKLKNFIIEKIVLLKKFYYWKIEKLLKNCKIVLFL